MRLKIIRTSSHNISTASALDQLKAMEKDVLKGVEYVFDPGGPGPLVENREEAVFATGEVLKRVRQTVEEGGFDAIVIQGFVDPGLFAAREFAPIPVICCAHAAMHVASLLGNRFSIVDALSSYAGIDRELAILYGFEQKLASVRSIETRVADLMTRADREFRIEITTEQSRLAVLEDGADTVIIGCSSMGWMVDEVQSRLRAEGLEVPVVYPYRAAISLAKALVEMKLSHSRLAFPPKEPKPQRGRVY